jgi:hypothetical protein
MSWVNAQAQAIGTMSERPTGLRSDITSPSVSGSAPTAFRRTAGTDARLDCKNALMHLKCQQRMLDAAPVATLHDLTRCRVCRKQFRNAETYGYWHLSQTGVLWLAWVVGAIVMFWSANTVLDKGSASDMRLVRLHFQPSAHCSPHTAAHDHDPRIGDGDVHTHMRTLSSPPRPRANIVPARVLLPVPDTACARWQDYFSWRWWIFQLHNLNWWRVVGILYFIVASGMGCTALCAFLHDLGSLVLALSGWRTDKDFLLLSLGHAVRVWDPTQPRLERVQPRLPMLRRESDGPQVLL